jgi:hypothetical protein
MNINEALNVLGLAGGVFTQEEIKTAYRQRANRYHPDKVAESEKEKCTEIMKAINAAYVFLKGLDKDITVNVETSTFYNYCEELETVLDALYALHGLLVEVCGNWIWITGETRQHAAALGKKGLGCFYASKKQAWYYRPEEHKSSNRGQAFSMDDIRYKYGSSKRQSREQEPLTACA